MSEFIIKYWVEVGLGLVVLALGVIGRWVTKQARGQIAVKNGMQALLRNAIYNNYTQCQDKGYCPIWRRENIEEMYTQYKELGGNGTVTKLVNDLHELPAEKAKVIKK